MRLYRELAFEKGYGLKAHELAGRKLAEDLAAFLSSATLSNLGCAYAKKITASWPALLVRPNNDRQANYAPIKHLLLLAYLTTAPVRSGSFNYLQVGKKPESTSHFDQICKEHILAQWELAKNSGKRVTIDDLTKDMPRASLFRHRRNSFPETMAVLEDFKNSNQAERQTGRRPYWRKRLGLDKKPAG